MQLVPVLNNGVVILCILFAVWVVIIPKQETIISTVVLISLFDTFRCWCIQKDKKFLASLLPVPIIIVVSTLVFSIIAIIFGAPILSDAESTLLFGTLLSVLVVYPTALTAGGSVSRILDTLLDCAADTDQQRQEVGAAAGALLGAWLGAFVIPLDWDRHWQVWPVPCCAGAQLGSAAGRLLRWPAAPARGTSKRE